MSPETAELITAFLKASQEQGLIKSFTPVYITNLDSTPIMFEVIVREHANSSYGQFNVDCLKDVYSIEV